MRGQTRSRLSFYRAAERLLESTSFHFMWESANKAHRERFINYFKAHDIRAMKRWIKTQNLKEKPLDDWPIRQLRPIGRDLCLPDWHLMTKRELLIEVRKELDG